jgi:hypothetical protein
MTSQEIQQARREVAEQAAALDELATIRNGAADWAPAPRIFEILGAAIASHADRGEALARARALAELAALVAAGEGHTAEADRLSAITNGQAAESVELIGREDTPAELAAMAGALANPAGWLAR